MKQIKNNKLISIIVPVYNSEKYLQKCIDSILCQTYKNLELILIDDGSDDQSKVICEKYYFNDDRVKLITQKNKGVSFSRNLGIEISQGYYICFVDSDDWIEQNCLEYCIDLLEKNNADIICFNYREIRKDNVIDMVSYNESMLDQDIISALYNLKAPGCVWNKVYKKNIWKNVRFPDIKKAEDLFVSFDIIFKAKKIIATSKIFYNYNKLNETSLTHTVKIETYIDNFIALNRGIENANNNRYSYLTNRIIIKAIKEALKVCQINIFNNYISSEQSESIYKFLKKYYKEYPPEWTNEF